ncbi:unnamed protein product [Tilletia controversa]|nr:unnamed protein product [Tilletia controversa]
MSKALTVDQIKTFHDSTSDDLVPVQIAPADVRDKLYPFLHKNFTFNHPKVMTNFARMLAASGSGDERWTTAERSAFLSRLCDPNRGGMDRVKEILLKPTVTKSTFSQHLLYQNGMILVFMFLTSSTVLKTAVATSTNLLYGIIDSYLDVVLNASKEGVRQLIESRGHNLQGSDTTSMVQVFKPLILLVNEYLNRFPAAALSRFDALHAFLSEVSSRLDEWVRAFTVGTFQDQLSCVGTDKERWVNFIKASLQQKITKMQQTLEFAKSSVTIRSAPAERPATHRPIPVGEGQLQMLIRDFDPPGGLRESGPRHDNDHALIRDVGVHPTSQEIACRQPPYIPYNFISAPHHLASGSPEQQLDIHFRLLREELVEPLRGSLSALSHELESLSQGGNQLDRLLKKGGGRFKAGGNCADLQVWGSGRLHFSDITCNERHGILVTVAFESQQSQKAWDYQLERLLNPGALVAVMSSAEEDDQVETFLGLVRSPPAEIKASVRNHRPTVKIEFFEKRAIHFALSTTKCAGTQLLAEVRGVMYESVAPFLRNLKETTSAQLPFAELLALPTSVPTSPMTVQPPRYAGNPTFSYNLSGLLRKESARASEGLHMTLNEDSQERARVVLKEHGTLDGTQADAVIDTLSREVGIIQGPPGTGKSYTGVALINTLLKSKIDPILVVCMTNHALDSVLSKVLDQGLTKNIVRLGSRSKDERISSYNLEALVATRQKTEDDRGARREWRNLKLAQEEMLKGVKQLKGGSVDNTQLFDLATSTSPDHVFSMLDFSPSLWPAISEWVASNRRQGSNKRTTRLDDIDIFDFWRCGVDLDMLQRPAATATASKGKDVLRDATAATNRYEVLAERSDSGSDAEEPWPCDMDDEDDDVEEREGREHASAAEAAIVEVEEETDEESLQDELTAPRPSWPDIKHRGSLELLLDDPNVWSYSRADRALLVDQWTAIFRQAALSSLDDIYDKVQTARAGVQEHRDQERLSVLRHCKIIGATTNGAAKAAELLKKVKPRVLLVEEAGQVLEAHILATLSSSVEHLILIGDHKQLRPQVTNYGLSMDNKRGRGHLHRLDFSMMERLAEESKLPVSRITTQRRMRPEICDLIRPVQELDDHDSVKHRGDIKGVATNCFFFSHDHAESAQETSRTNEFEADMAVDFVRHLVHQGYTGANDICIIVAYLSQIAKVKERLFSHQINIVLSEKDADALAEAEARDADADYHPEAVIVTQSLGTSVRVATVDNFQGEEAKIIILSLVRNQGVDSDEQLASSRFLRKSGIGFLKSPNRSYVALSRARDGLFVFGNAGLLHDHSPFWAQILEKMEAKGGIVGGIPIICSRHPEKGIREVSEVGQLRLLSPNGGCEEVCGDVRRCGHVCKAKCHPGDSAHTLLPCLDNCTRLLDCQHPCKKRCGDKCGPCDFIVPVVGLPCGHSAVEVRCAQVESGQDGHFQMSTFYNKGPNEDWQSSSSIPTDFFSAFVCPFCKKPASAMRYGRPKKRAFLDEQERKHIDAAERHCKFLAERTAQLDVDQLAQVFKSPQSKRQIQGPVQHTLTLKGQKKLLHQLARSSDPTPADFWDNLLQFGFFQSTAVAWAESVQPILAVNRGADRMLKEKSPHVQAWQAAVSQAHQRILATLDPRDVRRDQKALQLARASVSIPEPRAQSKYHLISIFIALDCRMLLATLGKTVDGAIQSKEDEKWPNFVDLILSSGSQDAQKAFKRAEESLHGKDALRAQAYDTRFRAELLMNKLGKSIAKAQGDALSLVELEQRAERDLGKLCRHWRQVVRATTADANFKDQIDSVVSQRLADVEHFVKLGQRRKEELKMIVSAMFTSNVDMRYGGHFYRCGNGHSFVIGNCGGAMEVSRCPECGVAIGGSDHTLAAGNTSDTEMEQIAREFGARPSPWPWARA